MSSSNGDNASPRRLVSASYVTPLTDAVDVSVPIVTDARTLTDMQLRGLATLRGQEAARAAFVAREAARSTPAPATARRAASSTTVPRFDLDAFAATIAKAIDMATSPLAARISALEADNAQKTARISALEARPTMEHVGVWESTRTYSIGNCVSHQGSTWYCTSANQDMRPGTAAGADCWRLAVKRGAQGRDLR